MATTPSSRPQIDFVGLMSSDMEAAKMAMESLDYQDKGKEFLRSIGVALEANFIKNGKYFPNDTETRDIYHIILRRNIGGEVFTCTFGQSIANSRKQGHMGTDYMKDVKKPTPYDVLASITKSDPGDFEDFCRDFGYSDDSISALRTFEAVEKEWEEVNEFFSDKELELMREIN